MTQPHEPPRTPPFQLFRDAHGIPHVRAAGERALAYGQGYVTALDRADQLETGRLRAEARLAARIGPDGLAWDRFAVRVRLADTARRVADALATPEREWLAAYARGVNAGLGHHDGPWRTWTPIGLFLVDHVLFNGFPAVLWRDHVARTLGPRFPGVPPATLAEWFASDGGPGAGSDAGSNAWAIAPDATASGSPLLAGDPHRVLELPGTYQQIRLACTAEDDDVPYDVLGLAFPGVPGVQHFGYALADGGHPGGHPDDGAGGVAWGITNAMAHHVEVFEERLRRGADGGWEAHGPDGWEPAASGRETIEIRDVDGETAGRGEQPPFRESVPWIETSRGVWIATRQDDTTPDEETRQFTIRWPVRVLADAGVPAWRRLLRARSARDVAATFGDGWVDPVNRVLTADSGGDILSLTAGRITERAPDERVLPVPAWTDAARERPWVRLPEPERVTTGVAVDANERPVTRPDTTTDDPPGEGDGRRAGRPRDRRPNREAHALGWSYAPYRADRIRHLLANPPAGGETPFTQHRIHADVSSSAALALMARLGTPEPLRPWAEAGAPMDADSTDAATFARWRDAIVRHLANDPRLDGLRPTDPHGTGSPYGEIYAPWFVPETAIGFGLPRLPDALDVGSDSLDLDTLWAGDPDDPAHNTPTAAWGDLHTLAPTRLPGGPELTYPTAPISGDNDTVRCTGSTPGVSPQAARGSVARWIWDLTDRRNSRWVVPFGASGVPGDPHTADQHATWAAGDTIPVETDWDRLEPVDPGPIETGRPSEPHPEPRRNTHGRQD
ncbi:penicillin acylase family protein [Myceligenerans pegani]|uniref:Penicillin acylase family protein n=1 Tax=Myceligenerans pegani TaxID=2776917 RepID=A0ABR9N575_9MICO|nr:penicillin acylase family protein [Myceligenerans sp. TRM 65318]MBE1878137.1 penicillin acylase family protein [Myceligenerans sp. TRM 65318]MBE3020408.1 penicillin acylase family protein [Myceligenerans sp. TRM 65318]